MLAFWTPGPMEILIIGVVALLIFGGRLPSVMKNLGKGIVEFKKGVRGIEDEVESASTDTSSSYTEESASSEDSKNQTDSKA
jgi:sec-independent protein translocase protein TatA